MKSNRTIIFILSENRSGSTWLSYVLGSHRDVFHLGEYYRPFIIHGHVACRLCEAKNQICPYFYDIHNITIDRAFDYAFERINSTFLVDCSKQLSWIDNFINTKHNIKVVHLIRDPRGWFASEKRRGSKLTHITAIDRWQKTNREIAEYIKSNNLDAISVLYEDLTKNPDTFGRLCCFLGFDFDVNALKYWNKEHHGLGGNGASFNIIGMLPNSKIVTADDLFYKQKQKKFFYDDRWFSELDKNEIDFLSQEKWLKEFLDSY